MASSQQMKASSSSHQHQMRLDEKAEHNCMDLGSDLVQLLLCSKMLHIPGNYFKFQRLPKGSAATFYNKKQLTWCRNFFYLCVLFLFSVSASVSQQNLYHGALSHKTQKLISDAAFLQHLVKSSTGASILTKGCCPQLRATILVL